MKRIIGSLIVVFLVLLCAVFINWSFDFGSIDTIYRYLIICVMFFAVFIFNAIYDFNK